mgnify:CR=1 FL=1
MGFVIAVDGPAASGKGTIAVRLGEHYGFPVLDTGLLYRAVGVRVLETGGDLGDEAAAAAAAAALDPADLERPQVRTREAGEAASRVAVRVIRTDEEWMMAKTVCRVLGFGRPKEC